jgi:hypothetical protein
MHKINSTSNIKNPMNMNININMNNNKNKIYLSEVPCTNIIENKIFQKSPFSLELETIKVTKRKKIFYPKKSEVSKKKIVTQIIKISNIILQILIIIQHLKIKIIIWIL